MLVFIFEFLIVVSFIISIEAEEDVNNIRFNKIQFISDRTVEEERQHRLPLGPSHFPINTTTLGWLRKTTAASIVIPEVCSECDDLSFENLIDIAGGYPSHPSSDRHNIYWDEFYHVIRIQIQRRNGIEPIQIMPLPDLWLDYTIDDVAEAVHDEYPGKYHAEYVQQELKNFNVDYDIIPYVCEVEFIRGIVMLSDLINWSIARVAQPNFGLKYHVGRARPEEVAWKISQRLLKEGPTPSIVVDIYDMNLTDAASFTAYPEGSPTHPSWPAMHSAGAAASLWMAVILDLTDEQWCQIKLTDYAVSYARVVAGVHYENDSLAGLMLGQEIMAKRLPNYLHGMYGSSITNVTAKINEKRFDWNRFLESDCAKNHMLY